MNNIEQEERAEIEAPAQWAEEIQRE